MNRFAKNLILMGMLAIPIFVIQYFGGSALFGFVTGTIILISLFAHDKIVSKRYWDGMLLPIILLGCFFSVGIGLERHFSSENWIFFIFQFFGFLGTIIFYIFRLLRREENST